MNKEELDALKQEHAIKKGVDVLILNIKRELKVRFGIELTSAQMVKVITELAKERA